jgi:phosphatidylinositol-3-phosphatase
MRSRSWLIVVALALSTLGVRSAVAAIPPERTTAASGPSHIAVIVFENHEVSAILGPNSDAPTFRSLARSSVNLTGLYATSHPSLPNYLALTSGSTHGITSDCTTCFVHARNIVDQLEHAGISWKAYMESIPGPCSSEAFAGLYALKHDPFLYYDDVRNNTNRCNKVVPLGQLRTDLNADALPRFTWITPNLCHDMHDCSVAIGDRFLHTWAPRIVAGLGTDGILIVVFDEGDTGAGCCGGQVAGGHIAGIISGPGAGLGVTIGTRVDQYSVLKLIEDVWGLPDLGSAASAPAILGWQPPA